MTQNEEKELLMADLSARLNYGVKVHIATWNNEAMKIEYKADELYAINKDGYILTVNEDYEFEIEGAKPYLFPMSSMTEEQEKKFSSLYYRYYESAFSFNERFSYDRYSIKDIGFYPYYLQDWLDSNHFDYRGLIEKGLAIDCTNLNIY